MTTKGTASVSDSAKADVAVEAPGAVAPAEAPESATGVFSEKETPEVMRLANAVKQTRKEYERAREVKEKCQAELPTHITAEAKAHEAWQAAKLALLTALETP